MAIKITGYGVYLSSGGNKCVQCGTRMRKGLPYLAPIRGKRVIHEVQGRSICISCIEHLTEDVNKSLQGKELDIERYERRRFMEHMDKD